MSSVKASVERVLKDLRHREDTAQSLCYTLSKEFMEAGQRRMAGYAARAATTGELQVPRSEARALKECVADLTLENRLKGMTADGGDEEPDILHPKSSRSSDR